MRIVRSRRFWLILTLFGLCSILHYVEQIGILGIFGPNSHFWLDRHALDRILFLLPIIYSGFAFGLVAGGATCFAALLVMLPRAIFISPSPFDAILETVGIMTAGMLTCLWLWTRTTERAKAQAALSELQSTHKMLQHYVQVARSNEERMTMLNAISPMLFGSLELEELFHKAIRVVSELMEVEVALIFSIDEGTQELRLVAHEGVSDELAQAMDRVKVSEGAYGEVAKTGHPIVVDDTSNYFQPAKSEFGKMQIRIQLIVPLTLRERVSGVICVAMRRPRQFTPDDIDMLTGVGTQIATAIENARLYEKERLTAQRLAVSERNYRRLFENASDAIWVHDLAGNIIAANKATEELTGYSREELIKMDVRDFLSDRSVNLAGEIRRRLLQKGPVEQPYEQYIIKKDRTETILMLTTSLVTEDGEPTGFQHMARDVTREKWIQDNLRYYLQQITKAQEEERKRIARELHDDTAQALYALTRQVDNFVRSNNNLPAGNIEFLKDVGEQTRKVLQGVRRFSQDLRPSMLDDLGLMATLRWLASELKERHGIEVDVRLVGVERRLPPEEGLALFRIIQEALRNIEKHAEASKARIEMKFGKGKIMVSVSDNGKGFKLSGDLGDLPREGRLGLTGMEERARLLNGIIRIESELGKGTKVIVEVPI